MAGAVGLLLIAAIVELIQIRRLRRRLDAAFGAGEGADWGALATRLTQRLGISEGQVQDLLARTGRLEASLTSAVTRIGIVRYSAFQGTGPDLSFSLALTDVRGSGVLLTGLHGREEMRLYLKPLKQGKSTYALSDEEEQALKRALEGMD